MNDTTLLNAIDKLGGIEITEDYRVTVDVDLLKLFKGRRRLKKKKAKRAVHRLIRISYLSLVERFDNE